MTSVVGALLLAISAVTSPTSSAPVPAPYQVAYGQLQQQVAGFTAMASKGGVPARSTPTFGIELLAANGNIGEGLLQSSAMTGVESELDAFSRLGARGVTVEISFPLLLPSTPQHRQYLAFYEAMGGAVRAHHMALSVEENPVYSGTQVTNLSISYKDLTLSSYAKEQRQQAQTIIDDLHPAYLTLLDEPDTFADAMGLPLNSPDAARQVVATELQGLRRDGTAVGAGTGTWSDPSIDRALLRTSIDYLDVHVYPIGPSELSNLQLDVAAARSAHRPLVMDETWLSKPQAGEGTPLEKAAGQLKEDSYSFWEPLDEQFVTAMATYVRAQGFRYVSYFGGSRSFFSYLDWNPTLEQASYAQFSAQYNLAVSQDMRQGSVSGSGLAFEQAAGRRATSR